MRSAYDVMRDSVNSCTMNLSSNGDFTYEIEARGVKFNAFLEWLKRTPYREYVHEPVKSVEEPKDEGISW